MIDLSHCVHQSDVRSQSITSPTTPPTPHLHTDIGAAAYSDHKLARKGTTHHSLGGMEVGTRVALRPEELGRSEDKDYNKSRGVDVWSKEDRGDKRARRQKA